MRWIAICLVTTLLSVGCTTSKTTNTARTAQEQLLISNAVDSSLDKVDFRPLRGSAVFLEEKYIDCVDKNYVVGSMRHRILQSGARLVGSADEADIIMEVRSGAVGTNTSESFLGFPELVLPGMMTLPEIRVVERTRQHGTAKIGVVAYDAKSKAMLNTGGGGVTLAEADDSKWFVVGVGPFQSGTLTDESSEYSDISQTIPRQPIPRQVAFRNAKPLTPEESAGEIQYTAGKWTGDLNTPAAPPAQVK